MPNTQARSRIDKNLLQKRVHMGNGADYTGRQAEDRINRKSTDPGDFFESESDVVDLAY
jgi:hypothetical protein